MQPSPLPPPPHRPSTPSPAKSCRARAMGNLISQVTGSRVYNRGPLAMIRPRADLRPGRANISGKQAASRPWFGFPRKIMEGEGIMEDNGAAACSKAKCRSVKSQSSEMVVIRVLFQPFVYICIKCYEERWYSIKWISVIDHVLLVLRKFFFHDRCCVPLLVKRNQVFDWIGSRNNSEKMENNKKRSYISFGFVEKDFR